MSKLLRVATVENSNGTVDIHIGDVATGQYLVRGNESSAIGVQRSITNSDEAVVMLNPHTSPQPVTQLLGGSIAGISDFRHSALTTLRDELDKDKINGDYDYMRQFKFDHKDIKAFGILGVSVGLEWKKIQDKFKLLVKKFHPDINAGNKKYEEKLKLITLAYTQLKNTYREKIDTKS
jgi:hypothetical protein